MDRTDSIAARLEKAGSIKALLGFDGFVDEIIHVVDKRLSADSYTRIMTMKEYAARIAKGSGLNTNIELVSVKKKIGGNGPILANALINYGMDVSYIGALGYPEINPIFRDFASGCKAFSITEPSHTEAYEFSDGKIIASKLEPFNKVTWDNITETVGMDALIDICGKCNLIGMENWTMLPYLSNIWKHFLDEISPRISKNKTLFFDLADPEKRSHEDIIEATQLINRFKKEGFDTILGLNRKEACEFIDLFTGKDYSGSDISLSDICSMLEDHIRVSMLVIHHAKQAVCIKDGRIHKQNSFYVENPVIATGAGDTFNSGFLLGHMNGCSPDECLLCGAGAAGYYVSHGTQPSCSELIAFIREKTLLDN